MEIAYITGAVMIGLIICLCYVPCGSGLESAPAGSPSLEHNSSNLLLGPQGSGRSAGCVHMSTGQSPEVAAVDSASLFTVALGLQTPWEVRDVDFDPQVGCIDFTVGFARGTRFTCTHCGAEHKGYGTLSTLWRTGCSEHTSSTSNAALSAIRQAPRLGQKPRRLQLMATRCSAWQPSQRTRRNPCSRRPHSSSSSDFCATYAGESAPGEARGDLNAG
jgi:hypothetical protein